MSDYKAGVSRVEKVGYVLGLVIFLLVLPQTGIPVHSLGFSSHGSVKLDPYDVGVWRFETLEGDRLIGNVSAEKNPIQMYIFRDGDYQYPDEFQVNDAIFNHYGMFATFDFVSDEDIDWLLVLINDHNITQNTEYYCKSYDPPVRQLISWAPIIVPFAFGLVIIVSLPILYYRRKKHQ